MNKEVKETAVKAITKKTVTNTKRETVMYIGPTVRGVVINGTLFKDGKLPALVKKRTEEMPVLQSLIGRGTERVKRFKVSYGYLLL